MNSHAHIFHPQSNSLPHRIETFISIFQHSKFLEQGMNHTDNQEQADTIGEREDLIDAQKIMQQSLSVAARSFNKIEIQDALSQGLLDKEQESELLKLKRLEELVKKQKQGQKPKGNGQGL